MKLGIIGTIWISDNFCVAAQKAGFEVTGVCSGHLENATRFAKKHNIEKVYQDAKEMLSSDIDVVYIATPNKYHIDYAKMYARKKIHVICEKPLAVSKTEILALKQICQENDVYFFEAMRTIHNPNIRILKESYQQSDDVTRSVTLNFMQYSSLYDDYKSGIVHPRFDPNFQGGSINDLGIYPIAFATYFFDKPKKVHCFSTKLDNGIDCTNTIVLEYDNFLCTIVISKVSNGYLNNEIQLENRTYVFDRFINTFSVKEIKKDQEKILAESPSDDIYSEAKDFYDIISTNDDVLFEYYANLTLLTTSIIEECHKQID